MRKQKLPSEIPNHLGQQYDYIVPLPLKACLENILDEGALDPRWRRGGRKISIELDRSAPDTFDYVVQARIRNLVVSAPGRLTPINEAQTRVQINARRDYNTLWIMVVILVTTSLPLLFAVELEPGLLVIWLLFILMVTGSYFLGWTQRHQRLNTVAEIILNALPPLQEKAKRHQIIDRANDGELIEIDTPLAAKPLRQ